MKRVPVILLACLGLLDVGASVLSTKASAFGFPPYGYTCGQLRDSPAEQFALFAYIAKHQYKPNAPGNWPYFTTNQAEHIARDVVEDLCSVDSSRIEPYDPGNRVDMVFWQDAFNPGVQPPRGPVTPIGNCRTDPACQ